MRLLLAFFLFWGIGSAQPSETKEEIILWNVERQLTWQDFKAKADAKNDAAAITSSGLTFGYRTKQTKQSIASFMAEISAHFYPKKSWVKRGKDTDEVLQHEQLHFDITELHARLFRKELSELRINNNFKQRVQEIYNRINLDMNSMQRLYDLETNHSINKDSQLRWNQEVQDALLALKEYSNPVLSMEKL